MTMTHSPRYQCSMMEFLILDVTRRPRKFSSSLFSLYATCPHGEEHRRIVSGLRFTFNVEYSSRPAYGNQSGLASSFQYLLGVLINILPGIQSQYIYDRGTSCLQNIRRKQIWTAWSVFLVEVQFQEIYHVLKKKFEHVLRRGNRSGLPRDTHVHWARTRNDHWES